MVRVVVAGPWPAPGSEEPPLSPAKPANGTLFESRYFDTLGILRRALRGLPPSEPIFPLSHTSGNRRPGTPTPFVSATLQSTLLCWSDTRRSDR